MFGLLLVTVLLPASCIPVFHNSGGVTAACLLLTGALVALPSWKVAQLQSQPLPA